MEKEAKKKASNKTNKLLLGLVIILGIAVVALTTFICTVLFVKPTSTASTDDKEVVAKEIKDIDIITELSVKIDTLLSKSDNEYHKVLTTDAYAYRYGLLKNTLKEEDKQWIVLNSVTWENLLGEAWKETAVKNYIESSLEYSTQEQAYARNKQLSAEKVNEYSKQLFGTPIISPKASIGKCPIYIYDETLKMYYKPDPQCGGTSVGTVKTYKSKFEEKGDEAYVYVSFGFLSPIELSATSEIYAVYRDFDYSQDLYFGEINYKNEYGRLENSYLVDTFEVDSTNYQHFSEYKFTFKKDKENKYYYFTKVEQTK